MAVEIVMPRLSDSMEEGTVLQWFIAEGDAVAQGEPLVEVETDKASVTYESEVDGTVLSITVPAGGSAAVGAVIALVGEPGETGRARTATAAPVTAAASPAPASATPAASPAPASATAPARTGSAPTTAAAPPLSSASPAGRVKASPLARRVAAELGIDLSTLVGTGPHGRVVRADVERSAAGQGSGNGAPAHPATDGGTRRPLTRTQQTIARRMAQSRATVPDFELRAEIDMTELVALREQLRGTAEPLPSYNDFIVKAVALALSEFPRVNGSYRDGELEEHAHVNVGIAVATDDALLVPTVFDADRKSVAQIAADARALAAKVRNGSITPSELASSTFTVSNLGMYGVDSFSAVINAPQAAILAVGSLRPRPVALADGAIVARNTVKLSLACDHRILYGADGARFLARLRELLQRPLALLL